MKELSLMTQRMVCEGVSKKGDILKVDITKKALRYLKKSWSLVKEAKAEGKKHKLLGKT